MIHKVGDEATVRVKMNWATAVGTVTETRDLNVVGTERRMARGLANSAFHQAAGSCGAGELPALGCASIAGRRRLGSIRH